MIKVNRTTQLLLPFYDSFGNEFINTFSNAIGSKAENIRLYLGDAKYSHSFKESEKFLNEEIIFVQFLEQLFNFEKHLLLMQTHQNYITDYDEEEYKIIVFKLDNPYIKALKQLKLSNYSKMYDHTLIEKYFSGTKHWYMMYVDDYKAVKFDVLSSNGKENTLYQLQEKWENLDVQNFYKHLIISPYHMFRKSENLRCLLETVYNAKIPKGNELITKINLKDEILNYEIEN